MTLEHRDKERGGGKNIYQHLQIVTRHTKNEFPADTNLNDGDVECNGDSGVGPCIIRPLMMLGVLIQATLTGDSKLLAKYRSYRHLGGGTQGRTIRM